MLFAGLSRPIKRVSLTYVEHGVRVAIEAAPRLGLRSVSIVLRRPTADVMWSTRLDGTNRAEFTILTTALVAAMDVARTTDDVGASDADQSVLVADLHIEVESGVTMPGIREGVHTYSSLGVTHSRLQASRSLEGRHGKLTVYARKNGNLSFSYRADQIRPRVLGSILYVRGKREGWEIKGEIRSGSFALSSGVMTLVPRRSGESIEVPTTITHAIGPDVPAGERRTRFSARLDQDLLLGRFHQPEFLDVHFSATFAGYPEAVDLRIRRLAPRGRLLPPKSLMNNGATAGELLTYRTFKSGSLALEFRPLSPDGAEAARHGWWLGKTLRWKTRSRPVWLIGERPETAQDTGIALYEHLRDHHCEIDARYVLTDDSPDAHRLQGDPGLVTFGSRKHVEATLAARRILGSHHADYLMPVRGRAFQRNVKARRIFLQHGVMGTKNMVANYGYSASGFTAEAFLVSSERERQMIEDDFGWPPERVFVTGLSRHDRLLEAHEPPERRILVMPTWRDWLKSPQAVSESEFLRRWVEILTSARFTAFLAENALSADFYLHSNMQAYAHLFDLPNVTVLRHGEVGIQDLLIRSMFMLTDYTSAAIDFSFLDRPVIYYQFDRSRFLGRRPSHFDLEAELPGEIVAKADDLLDALDAAAKRGFVIHPEALRKSRALIAHRDGGSRERIVEATKNAPRRRLSSPATREAVAAWLGFSRRARRSRRYAAMKKMVSDPVREAVFRCASKLPRSGLVVFETNLGRDFGDSPGAIFRALRCKGIPSETAWVTRKGKGAPSPSRGLPRLTYRYAWAMGRASVWVGNQNMPRWMNKPPRTTYVQTWHGTPLKRMLHDLDTVWGRDVGYVERIDKMVRQWSVLLSQSPWATARLRSAFNYRGEVLEVGYPRNDILLDGSVTTRSSEVRRRLGLHRTKRVLLYAPTFRDDQRDGTRFTFKLPIDLVHLAAAVGDDYEIVVRLHPIVRSRIRLPWGVYDAGAGFEMEDLLAAADVMVTDYSSVMFDYTVLGRPMVFFVPDLERYRDSLRGFYFDFEATAPGPLVRTTAELVDVLRDDHALVQSSAPALAAFRDRFCPDDDGRAGERVVDALIERGVLPPPR